MDVQQYELFGLADRDFYESPANGETIDSYFAAVYRMIPAGWTRDRRDAWVHLRPSEVTLAKQGWKIHVSACLDNASTVLDMVWAYCLKRRLPFTFLCGHLTLLARNAKYAARESSGKFVTIYPRDVEELRRVLNELGTALEGQLGPYILSDLRWHDGPLYVRYGAHQEMYCAGPDGERVAAIENPDGRLVPDDRRPGFTTPPWVPVPRFLAEQLAERDAVVPHDFPYTVEQPLHFSNAGGVYAATERSTGRRVTVKEARPFAGLDTAGTDAVARLRREHAMLRRLAGLPVVPQVLDFRTSWEHTFLVEEFIEGTTLARLLAPRNPLVQANPSREDVAEYTRWALGLLDQIEQALNAIHARGVIFRDLHPDNIRVRDDGGIVFVDFELASEVDEQVRLGAPGFTIPEGLSGLGIDRYALACLRLWFFLPLTPLLDRGAGKAVDLADAVAARFPVPKGYVEQVLGGLGLADTPKPQRLWTGRTWDALRTDMVDAIVGSATPSRPDRLFPGDIRQFTMGGAGVAHGAAGVLYALSVAGCARSEEHEQWLLTAAQRPEVQPRAGFYDGLSGIAYVLDHLGYHDVAMRTVDRAVVVTNTVVQFGLFEGLAGIGLNLLHFATQSPKLMLAAHHVAARLATAITTYHGETPLHAGLMRGFSGPALFFVRLYEETGEQRCLDLAAMALRHDLACCVTGPDGTLRVDDVVPYVAAGGAGIGLVLHEYLAHRADEEFLVAQRGIRLAAEAEFVAQSGLFNGRAGLIIYLACVSGGDVSGALAQHLARLAWHAVPYDGGIAFPGDHLVRLSMDLATGSAGVLLAMNAALGNADPGLPFIRANHVAAPARGC